MTPSLMRKRVNDLANAKSAQDIKTVLGIYHPDATLITIGLDAEANGSIEIEQQLQIFFALFPDYQVTIEEVACNETTLLATGYVSVTPTLPDQTGHRVKQLTSFSFEFADNQISKEIFFLDFGMLCKQAGISQEQLTNGIKQHIAASQAAEVQQH